MFSSHSFLLLLHKTGGLKLSFAQAYKLVRISLPAALKLCSVTAVKLSPDKSAKFFSLWRNYRKLNVFVNKVDSDILKQKFINPNGVSSTHVQRGSPAWHLLSGCCIGEFMVIKALTQEQRAKPVWLVSMILCHPLLSLSLSYLLGQPASEERVEVFSVKPHKALKILSLVDLSLIFLLCQFWQMLWLDGITLERRNGALVR